MATDITQSERKVPDSPDLLVGIIASAMDAIIAIDDAQRIVVFNAAAEKMFCCLANEAMGSSVERFIPQRFRAGHSMRVRRFDESGVTNRTLSGLGTLWGLRATGEEFPIEATISKVESGGKKFFTVVIRDITERHRAEEAVRESEQRFRFVANAAPVLIWMSGTDKLCTYFNKPWLDFTGRSMEKELGNGWTEGVHPEDLQRCLDTYTQSFDRRDEFRMEYRLRRRNGEYRWVLDVGVPRFNQDRSFAGYIGIAVDVTDEKLAEEARFRHAAIVESYEDAIISKDLDAVITSWNIGAERIFGYKEEEVVGRPITILIPPELSEEENKILERLRAGGRIEHYETKRLTKTGKQVDVSLRIVPNKDSTGRVLGFTKIAHDITQRKEAEKAVKESETRFRLVADTAPVMIWMAGLDKKPTYFNQLWLDFTGLSETDLLNGLVGIAHPEDYPQCRDVYCLGFDQRQPFRKECRLRRHDGQYRWMLDIGVPRFHEDGSFAGYIGSCIDVTDRKLAEEALTNISRNLIEAQEQERARIGRELHDDINQRLAMLAIELEQLQQNPSEVQTRLQELRKQTTELSNDVQALSHELHSSKLEYLGVVSGIKSWCNQFSERQKMEIDFKSDVSSVLPLEVGVCLFRVLQEALHNTSKHSGVKRLEVQLREVSSEIHLIVTDLGRGFDVEAAIKGQGLGLTSMQERVRLLNGSIAIESKPKSGTTIHVRVPFGSEHGTRRAAG